MVRLEVRQIIVHFQPPFYHGFHKGASVSIILNGKVERRSQGFNYEITFSIATIINSTLYFSEGWWGLEFLKKHLEKVHFLVVVKSTRKTILKGNLNLSICGKDRDRSKCLSISIITLGVFGYLQ